MSLKIRLQRHGAKGAPLFRMVVCEHTTRRDGRFVEILGSFNPSPSGQDKKQPLRLKLDRIEHWMKVGAKPSDTAWTLIKQARKAPPAVAEAPAAAPAAEPVVAASAN